MIELEALSKRGAKLLRRHGNRWVVLEQQKRVPCLGMVTGYRIISVRTQHLRWVSADMDHPDPDVRAVGRVGQNGRVEKMHGSWLATLDRLVSNPLVPNPLVSSIAPLPERGGEFTVKI